MREKSFVVNVILTVVVSIAIMACMVIKAFIPAAVLPPLNIPNMAALSLLALLIDHYAVKKKLRCYVSSALTGAAVFGFLPYVAGLAAIADTWKPALVGAAVYTLLMFLFSSIEDRISTGPKARLAPIVSAFGLYLAFQCFGGMIL